MLNRKIKNQYLLVLLFFLILFLVISAYYLFFQEDKKEVIEMPNIEKNLKKAAIGLDSLIEKLNTEFMFQQREGKKIYFPEKFSELKQGNELDFALYTAQTLKLENLGEVAIMRYSYLNQKKEQGIGTVVIFRGINLPPKYITFGENGAEVFTYGWSFRGLFQIEEQRLGVTINNYELFLLWPLPSTEDLWPE